MELGDEIRASNVYVKEVHAIVRQIPNSLGYGHEDIVWVVDVLGMRIPVSKQRCFTWEVGSFHRRICLFTHVSGAGI